MGAGNAEGVREEGRLMIIHQVLTGYPEREECRGSQRRRQAYDHPSGINWVPSREQILCWAREQNLFSS